MTPNELVTALRSPNPPHLLDVRQPDEHALVALPNSTLIPLAHVPERADEIEAWKDEDVVVYCHHGVRSAMAIAYLRNAGFKKLHNLSGGIARWTDEVDPTLPRY
jgi:rhodanese-related sulfurtransferase